MAKAKRSGNVVRQVDVPIILGMLARGDRKHDIAAWFGLNQGRVNGVEDGKYGSPPMAPSAKLPPAGSPGPRATALRAAVKKALQQSASPDATAILKAAIAEFDKDLD